MSRRSLRGVLGAHDSPGGSPLCELEMRLHGR
jgi:hypothetical protein